ncbi:cystathionine gamma-synthase [Clostridiales bacterium PH28_bin88]|nr:cystathionine gamma-synthase [Clostridiales bacterium PH28_bin88]
MQFSTKLLHPGCETDQVTGAVSVPIYQVSTFKQPSVDHPGEYDYARSGNPTRRALEETIAQLEGGVKGFAFASGMAAISSVFCLFNTGDHLVVCQDVYGGTYRVLTRLFNRFGIQATFVDTTDLDKIRRAIRDNTRALYLETPSNPLMKITDLAGAVGLARERGLLTIVDNTFMTPYLQRPLELGADIVVHSATKFLGGHSDLVAGLVAVKEERLAREVGFVQNSLGAVLGPQDSWLLMRGMKTLQVRLDREQETAGKIAEWLAGRPEVTRVYYPGLIDHPGYGLHRRQAKGPGAVLSFELSTPELAWQVMERVQLPALAVSLGAVESILSYPVTMSHAAIPPAERHALGITDSLLRLSVGLEDADDLVADLAQALEAL